MDRSIAKEIDNQAAWEAAREKGYKGSAKTFYVATYKRKIRAAAEPDASQQVRKKRGRKPKVAASPVAHVAAPSAAGLPSLGLESALTAYIDSQVKSAVKQAVEESLRDLFARIATK